MVHIRRRSPLLALALAIGLALAPAMQEVPLARAAQPATLQVRPDAAARLDAYFSKLVQDRKFSGAVLLARGDTVLLSKGYGMADWSRQIHNSSSTQFILPFMGLREFASASLLRLEDAGKLHEGDHICAFIPRCPAAWAPITVHELVSFTSGIHNYTSDTRFLGNGQSLTLAQLVAQIGAFPLDYKPGTKCCSDLVAPIEAYLVERISGESFATYLRRHLLGPLGLAHTGYFLHYPPSLPRLAVGYQSWQEPGPRIDLSSWGGVIYSSLTDFYRWDHALLTGRVLSASATARLITPAFTTCPPRCSNPDSTSASTEGIYVETTRDGLRSVGDTGWGAGPSGGPAPFGGGVAYFPAAKTTFILLANLYDYTWFMSAWPRIVPLIFG